jgi:hypothetical protein
MKMRYLFALLFISSCTESQDLTCVDFKIGTFKAEGINYKLLLQL